MLRPMGMARAIGVASMALVVGLTRPARAETPDPALATALSAVGTVAPAALVAWGLSDDGPDVLIAVGGLAFMATPTVGHRARPRP